MWECFPFGWMDCLTRCNCSQFTNRWWTARIFELFCRCASEVWPMGRGFEAGWWWRMARGSFIISTCHITYLAAYFITQNVPSCSPWLITRHMVLNANLLQNFPRFFRLKLFWQLNPSLFFKIRNEIKHFPCLFQINLIYLCLSMFYMLDFQLVWASHIKDDFLD